MNSKDKLKTESSPERTTIIGYFTMLVTALFSSFSLYYYFLGHDKSSTALYLILLAVVFANWAFFRGKKREAIASYILALVMLPVLIILQLSGGPGGAGIYLFYMYIPYAIMLLGRYEGSIWVVISFLGSFVLYVFQVSIGMEVFYPELTMAVFYVGYWFDFGVVSFSQLAKERYQIAFEKGREEIQQEKAKDEAILESIGDSIVVVDLNENIILVNRAFEYLMGFNLNDVVGKKVSEVVSIFGESGNAILQQERLLTQSLQHQIKTTSTTLTAQYYQRKNGTRFPVAVTVTPIYVGKEMIGAVEVFRDITHEKEIDTAKSEFVSLASHQLRTPLSSINWYTEMLLAGDAGKVTDEQAKYLDEIYHGNQRMVELVDALLNVSRIELGTFMVQPQPIDIKVLADDILRELEPKIIAREMHIEKHYSEDIPIINLDPKLTRMIVENLLTNAVKYTPPRGTVSLTLAKQDDVLLITVQDTGYGIPKDQQGKVFSKLFRADNIRDKETDGTGLGLYLVKAILKSAGGEIWFKSEEEKGTSFFISIPLSGMQKRAGSKALK